MELETKEPVALQNRPRLNTLGCLLIMGSLLLVSLMVFGNNRVEATDSISITARVGAPLPNQPAKITTPVSEQIFQGEKTGVEGTCQPKMYITVLSNDQVRGGTICSEEGAFAVNIDLSTGENNLTAQTHDGIDQSGPVAAPVKIFYKGVSTKSLGLSVDKAYQRIALDDTLSWRVDLKGDASIYAVRVDWGDGTSDLLPTTSKSLVLSHKYEESGARAIKISAGDDQNNKDEINLVASVSSLETLGQGVIGGAGKYLSKAALYITVLLMAASFMVGNYYQGGKKYVWTKVERQEAEIA